MRPEAGRGVRFVDVGSTMRHLTAEDIIRCEGWHAATAGLRVPGTLIERRPGF